MIYGRHTGINVSSLGKSVVFYCGVLGLHIEELRSEVPGKYIDTLTGIRGTVQHWAKVATDDGYLLELVQWVTDHADNFWTDGGVIRYDKPGINHLCFRVDDITQMYERLVAEDCEVSDIQTDPAGKVKNCHTYDPDGNIVELVEVFKRVRQTGDKFADYEQSTFTTVDSVYDCIPKGDTWPENPPKKND